MKNILDRENSFLFCLYVLDRMTSVKSNLKAFLCDSFGSRVGREWERWKRAFDHYVIAAGIENAATKKSHLLHYGGEQLQDVFENLPPETQGPKSENFVDAYKEAIARLDKYFIPKRNETFETDVFWGLKQNTGETMGQFHLRLCQQARYCGFGEQQKNNIKAQLINKCASTELREKLLKKPRTLEEVLDKAAAHEVVKEQTRLLKASTSGSAPGTSTASEVNEIKSSVRCGRCGSNRHNGKDKSCPAISKECFKCGKTGHFASRCKTNPANIQGGGKWNRNGQSNRSKPYNKQQFGANKQTPKDEPKSGDSVNNVDTHQESYIFAFMDDDEEVMVQSNIGGVMVPMMIDSGCKFNIIGRKTWEQMKKSNVEVFEMKPCGDKNFNAYGDNKLPSIGTFKANIEVLGQRQVAQFYVLQHPGKSLLGRDTARQMGVLKINTTSGIHEIVETSVKPLSKMKDIVVKIPIDDTVKPVIQPYRRVPVPLEDAVDRKIEELLLLDIIEPVKGSAEWVSPMVVVPKDGGKEVRLCLDMRRANLAIKRENYPLPIIDDFLPHIGGAKLFSKLDVRNAFHQIEIAPESRAITTFITKRGLFRYKRLMFGISCAPEMFQKIMEQILAGCEGCVNFADDIFIYGKNKEEHDKRLDKVLAALKDKDIELKEEKCVFGVSKIKFLGHELSEHGISPSLEKVKAVKMFREPKTQEEVRSFLGLVNYIGRFIPDLATLTFDLRHLTKKEEPFVWGNKQKEAFAKLKNVISDDAILGYYDVRRKTMIFADASPVGLGAVLVQEGLEGPCIISYASKSLSDVEKRYCQTEKEALALVWAVERFHYYVFGKDFFLLTDHRPLEVLFGPKSRPCARIERWVLRLQSYNYTIRYKPGKVNIADPLSRLCEENLNHEPFDEFAEHYINNIVECAKPVAITLKEISDCSQNDEEIQIIKKALYNDSWDNVPLSYKIFQNEFCFAGSILLRCDRIVIPKGLREKILRLGHEGHPGGTVMKNRMRAKVWWPKIGDEIEKCVKQCLGCLRVSAPDPPEPLKRTELPSKPWQHLAADFMGPIDNRYHLLVIVDYYSRFIEVDIMTKIDARNTVERMEAVFARFGFPESLRTDNGPQFDSEEFKSYFKSINVKLNPTIPYWPQMNGEVERQNRSLLKRIKISHGNNSDWKRDLLDFLLLYRSTKHQVTGKTPAELMFGWNIKDKLPVIPTSMDIDDDVLENDKLAKAKGKVQ